MISFELTNKQREYFGLDPIEDHWDRVLSLGDKRNEETVLYFDGDIIKRHIISTQDCYQEYHYNDLTRNRTILLPKTAKGKEKKLTACVFAQQKPIGIYLTINSFGDLKIGNHNTQTTFYSTQWERRQKSEKVNITNIITEFIEQSPSNHLNEIKTFKNAKRKNIKYKVGDYFCFKLNRTEFGFGRLLLDINKARKKGLLPRKHGLSMIMGPPLIIQLFAYKSSTKEIDISILDSKPKLPADIMMDNLLFYGEYEIIGHKELKETDFEFPISYGRTIDQREIVFLQWGLIHKELPKEKFNKYTVGEKAYSQNPFGYYSIGFRPTYDTIDIVNTISNNGIFDFEKSSHYVANKDLRNPKNNEIKRELLKVFGLDPDKSYIENCELTCTTKTIDFIKQLN
jgi:hypothetical protein